MSALRRLKNGFPIRISRQPQAQRTASVDLREIAPSLGRNPSAQELLDEARAVVIRAMRDEFLREGLVLVDLPADWTRRTLLESHLADDHEYQAFVDRSLHALALDADPQPVAHVAQELRARESADRAGLTLEAAGAVAALLVSEAVRQAAPAGDGPHDRDRYLERLEAVAQGQLRRMVTVPQELRVAQQRLAALEEDVHEALGTDAPSASSAEENGAAAPTLGERAAALRDYLNSDSGRRTVGMMARGAAAAAANPVVRRAGRRIMGSRRRGTDQQH